MSAFEGIRIVDFTQGLAGPMATMMLADFGAEVIKVEPPGGDRAQHEPGYWCWNRNKLRVRLDVGTYEGRRLARDLIASADVAVFDDLPGELERLGFDAGTLTAAYPSLLHVWLPPYAPRGRWSYLPPEEQLLAAVTGACWFQFSWDDVPVELVTPQLGYAHALIAAGAIAAGLLERRRSGLGQAVTVGGIHGFAVVESGGALRAGEVLRMRAPGARGALPHYRLYRCADGEWLFLGTLMPHHFYKALEVLDLFDVMALPGVDGEFSNLMRPEVRDTVIARFDERFAERPREEWLALLEAAGVPRAPVWPRERWFTSEQGRAIGMRAELEHPELGTIVMPGLPLRLSETPASIRSLIRDADPRALLRERPPAPPQRGEPPPQRPGGPLAGFRVLDLGMVIAGTFIGAILANFGADVVKVEPPEGDPFRQYGLGFAGYNQGKRSIVLDLKERSQRETFYQLVERADAVLDNYRLGVLERLGIDYATLSRRNPRIVQASVTGYGSSGPMASLPGFDPLLQAQRGLMAAQGGDDEPVFHQIPVNDTATSMVAAFGILAALFARERTGRGQRVETSLAAQSILFQSGELTWYAGRPAPAKGGRDFPGVRALDRLYRCRDGWLAIVCRREEEFHQLCVALGHPEWAGRFLARDALDAPSRGPLAELLAEAFAALERDEAIERLLARGVPCAPALRIEEIFASPWHRENGLFWECDHPQFGPLTLVRSYAEWSRTPGGFSRRPPLLGEHTEEVLAELAGGATSAAS